MWPDQRGQPTNCIDQACSRRRCDCTEMPDLEAESLNDYWRYSNRGTFWTQGVICISTNFSNIWFLGRIDSVFLFRSYWIWGQGRFLSSWGAGEAVSPWWAYHNDTMQLACGLPRVIRRSLVWRVTSARAFVRYTASTLKYLRVDRPALSLLLWFVKSNVRKPLMRQSLVSVSL